MSKDKSNFNSVIDTIGNTPLVALQRLNPEPSNQILLKLEGNNPGGSVKDRAALNMILQAERRGDIKPGDTLVEATSGNTGIALAMVAAMRGYQMRLIMPDNMTQERKDAMAAYGAELVLVTQAEGMEGARDLALNTAAQGHAYVLNQFDNPDNSDAHYQNTGPEIWQQSQQQVTHFISAMGTTGTISGTGRYLKQQNSKIQIVGAQPASDSDSIPGIRKWPQQYLPAIYDDSVVDQILPVTQPQAEHMTRQLAQQEGVFCGISSGGTVYTAISLSAQLKNACIVAIICDRGDRYLSSGVYQ